MRSPGDEISQQKFIGPFGWQRRLCRGQSDLNKCSACASAFLKCVFQSPRRAVSPMSWQLRSCARRDAPLDGNGRARPHHYHHAQSCPLPCHRVKALACSRFAARRPARAFAAAERVASTTQSLGITSRGSRHRHVAPRDGTRRLAAVADPAKMQRPYMAFSLPSAQRAQPTASDGSDDNGSQPDPVASRCSAHRIPAESIQWIDTRQAGHHKQPQPGPQPFTASLAEFLSGLLPN
jgi:hypothetical protein